MITNEKQNRFVSIVRDQRTGLPISIANSPAKNNFRIELAQDKAIEISIEDMRFMLNELIKFYTVD